MSSITDLLSKLITLRSPCPDICDGTIPLGGPTGAGIVDIKSGLPTEVYPPDDRITGDTTGNTCSCETWTINVSGVDLKNSFGNSDPFFDEKVAFAYYKCNENFLTTDFLSSAGTYTFCLEKKYISPGFPGSGATILGPPYLVYKQFDAELFYTRDGIFSSVLSKIDCCP